jgi:hypothetical protein
MDWIQVLLEPQWTRPTQNQSAYKQKRGEAIKCPLRVRIDNRSQEILLTVNGTQTIARSWHVPMDWIQELAETIYQSTQWNAKTEMVKMRYSHAVQIWVRKINKEIQQMVKSGCNAMTHLRGMLAVISSTQVLVDLRSMLLTR